MPARRWLMPCLLAPLALGACAGSHHDRSGSTSSNDSAAIGSREWPARTGEWTITQVVLNPDWIPPTDEQCAEDADSSPPGDPDNPLGQAQLVCDPPMLVPIGVFEGDAADRSTRGPVP